MAEPLEDVEAIAILNPSAVDTSRQVITQDIPPDWSVMVSVRLASCSIQASCLARVKYADMHNLRHHLHNMVIDKLKPGMPTLPIVKFVNFADMAISEVVDPRVCRWCRGVKWFPETDDDGHETGRRITCGGCGGNGEHQWHDKERMERLQLTEKEWKNKYMAIYNRILGQVWEWDSEVRKCMKGVYLTR